MTSAATEVNELVIKYFSAWKRIIFFFPQHFDGNDPLLVKKMSNFRMLMVTELVNLEHNVVLVKSAHVAGSLD